MMKTNENARPKLVPLTLEESNTKMTEILKSFEIIKVKFGEIDYSEFWGLTKEQQFRIIERAHMIVKFPECDEHLPINIMIINGVKTLGYFGYDTFIAYKIAGISPQQEVCCYTLRK